MSYSLVKKYVQMLLSEADIEDVSELCYARGSTHLMNTCKIKGNKYYLKFSDPEGFYDDFDPSLQILGEYLAYRIYGLYSGINIPTPELVYDKKNAKVGLATSPVPGKTGFLDRRQMAKKLSQGVYVDVFLANWDVVAYGNTFIDEPSDKAYRLDPGGAMLWRAQGKRKGPAFGKKASELQSMLRPGTSAGSVYQYADLKKAADTFLKVSWSEIKREINNVDQEISEGLESRGLNSLLQQWKSDVKLIVDILEHRYEEVEGNAKFVIESSTQ